MSKCSVFRIWKLRFLYWTLLRPKYCADAGSAPNARRRAHATARTRWAIQHLLLDGRVADFDPSAAVWLGRAVLRDGAMHFVARLRFGVRALGRAHGVDRFARQIFSDQVLDEDRQQLGLAERGVRLRQRIADRVVRDAVQ